MACQHHLSQAKVRKGREVMPLALNRTGTIVKKCDMSNHRPETVKRCASASCQHTCATPEKCSHAWTLRYSVNGKQVEKSFKDTVNESNGRTNYGSGKKLAQDFQLQLTADKRSGDITFADHGKTGKAGFGTAVESYISRMSVGENSKTHYLGNYRTHVKPVFGDRTLAQVAKWRYVLFAPCVHPGRIDALPNEASNQCGRSMATSRHPGRCDRSEDLP